MAHNVRSDTKYFIRNVKGGTVIDLSGADNESIIGYPLNGGSNQKWETEQVDGGWYIRNHKDGRFLALNGTPRDGLSVVVRDEPFLWHIWGDEEVENGVRICVPDTRMNIDLTDYGSEKPGTPIAIWGRWNANNQSGNKYFIRNVKGGTVVDLSGEDNQSIIGYPRNDGENQQWEVEEVDGGWYIKNVQDGRYLALPEEPRDDLTVVVSEEPYIWHLWGDEEIEGGVRICVPNTQQNLDLTNYGSEEPGTRVAIWGRWQANNQIWYFDEA
ncbi:hypothetical protein CVT24_012663 [Panaeolus cyanescens]|uniref:Ricin B lectin domain-containing protein n=1 Tax=Panaeolus cyanescens TaxID=181874 RepID=A0A409W2G3_9AGAR|nr:hypothetical protein CVT24_012663 [Panaeolus cyanescens]